MTEGFSQAPGRVVHTFERIDDDGNTDTAVSQQYGTSITLNRRDGDAIAIAAPQTDIFRSAIRLAVAPCVRPGYFQLIRSTARTEGLQ
jgi:hypothetical protein